jgi:hypothetical protein
MKWLFKSKEQNPTLLRLANAINRKNGSKLITLESSEFFLTELPFYNGFKLYTLVDLSFTPYFKQRLLDNGLNTIVLDGSILPFIEANISSPIILTTQNVFEYANLVLDNIIETDSNYKLISSIEDVDFSSDPSFEEYTKLNSSIKSPRIRKENDHFLIIASMIHSETVYEALIKVTLDGRVDILKEKKILENMPIHELIPEL